MSIQFFSDSSALIRELARRRLTYREAAAMCWLSPTAIRYACLRDKLITHATAGKLRNVFGTSVVRAIDTNEETFDQTKPQKFSRVYTAPTEEALQETVIRLMHEAAGKGLAIVSVIISETPDIDGKYSAVVTYKSHPALIRHPNGVTETVGLSTEEATKLDSNNREVILQAWLSKEAKGD